MAKRKNTNSNNLRHRPRRHDDKQSSNCEVTLIGDGERRWRTARLTKDDDNRRWQTAMSKNKDDKLRWRMVMSKQGGGRKHARSKSKTEHDNTGVYFSILSDERNQRK